MKLSHLAFLAVLLSPLSLSAAGIGAGTADSTNSEPLPSYSAPAAPAPAAPAADPLPPKGCYFSYVRGNSNNDQRGIRWDPHTRPSMPVGKVPTCPYPTVYYD